VCRGHGHGGHHDAGLSGGPRLGQATSLRSVRFAADGLDRTAAPPGARNYVMASRQTVAHGAERIGSSSKESRRYDPISSGATDDHDVERGLARRAIIATNRYERSFARSLDKLHASSSPASWRRSDGFARR
jgi:hypothetical protein